MTIFFCILPIIVLTFYKRNSRTIFYVMAIIFIVLAGFRDPLSEHNDSHNYFTLFKYGEGFLFKHVEIGYTLINVIVMRLNLGFQWVIIITSSISIFTLAWAAKRSEKNEASVLLIYFLLTYLFYNFNAMRQMTGVSFLILGYTYLKEERVKNFLLCVFIGYLFHKSCLIAIVCLLFYKKSFVFQPTFVFVSILVSLIIGSLNITPTFLSYIADLFPKYLHSDMDKQIFQNSFSLSKLALSAFFMYMYLFLNREDLYIKIVFVGIVLFNLMSFSAGAMRIAYAFTPAQALLFALPKNNYECDNDLEYNNYELYIYGYCLFVYYYMLLNSVGLMNYKFCNGNYF